MGMKSNRVRGWRQAFQIIINFLLFFCYVGSWVSVILAIVAIVTGIVGAAVFLARLLVIELV